MTIAKYTTNLKVDEWFDEIDNGLEYRRRHGLEDHWSQLEALFYNTHPSMASNSPNLIAATGDSFLSDLTVPRVYITVQSRRDDSIDGQPIVESVVNDVFDDLQVIDEFEAATLYAFLWGRGFLKIGFDSEYGYSPGHDIGGDAMTLGMTMTQFDKKGRRLEFSGVRPGMPWVQAVLPHDIIVPWGTRVLDRSPWMFHRVVRHIEDIRKDPKYSGTRDLQPVMSMEDYTKSYESVLKPYRVGWTPRTTSSRKSEFCELWEGRDARTGRIFTLATGHKKKLRDDGDLLQTSQGYPFVSLGFVPRARTIWTTPDAYYLKYHQADQTDIAIQATKQRRISAVKFLYDSDIIDDDELAKMLSADVGVGAKVKSGRNIKDAIHFITHPPANMMLYQDAMVGEARAREVVGLSRNAKGEFSKGRKSATETRVVEQGSGKRMGRRVRQLKGSYESLARKTIAILASLWRAPRVTEVLGPEGESVWLRYTGADLRGKYSYRADFTTQSGDSVASRRQEALMLYQGLSQDPMADPVALRRYLMLAYNDPDLRRVFRMDNNANLRTQMSQLPGGGRGPVPGQGSQSPSQLPIL